MAPDTCKPGLQHQMVPSMGIALWRSQPWTVSSAIGPVTTSLQAEQLGAGSDPGTALSQTEIEEDENPIRFYIFSLERNSRRYLSGSFAETGRVGAGACWREATDQRLESKATSKAKVATWCIIRLGPAFSS